MQQLMRPANMTFMIQRKITFPAPQQLKIMTQLEENIPKFSRPKDDFVLALVTIFTQKQSYQGELTGKSIAKQLSWNPESFNTLLECLIGKRQKLQMKFFPVQNNNNQNPQKASSSNKDQLKNTHNMLHHFEIVCEISSGINLVLFTVEMHPSNQGNPFLHMMRKFSRIQKKFRIKQISYKEKEDQLKSQLNQIEAVEKQIIDSSMIEINLMKKEFIKHVNNEKAKIRKLMGTVPMINPLNGLIQNRPIPIKQTIQQVAEKQVDSQEQSKREQIKSRVIKKVDKQYYETHQNLKMELQSEIYSKFSSQSSNQNQIIDKFQQKKQELYRKGRKFTEDKSSSDDEIDPYGNKNNSDQIKKQRTFLQEERQKMQKGQQIQNNQWDALFN